MLQSQSRSHSYSDDAQRAIRKLKEYRRQARLEGLPTKDIDKSIEDCRKKAEEENSE